MIKACIKLLLLGLLTGSVDAEDLKAGERTKCVVIEVIDGDSVWLDCLHDEIVTAQKVHFYGIKSPRGEHIASDQCFRHPMRFKGQLINYYALENRRMEPISIVPMHKNLNNEWVAKIFVAEKYQHQIEEKLKPGPLYVQLKSSFGLSLDQYVFGHADLVVGNEDAEIYKKIKDSFKSEDGYIINRYLEAPSQLYWAKSWYPECAVSASEWEVLTSEERCRITEKCA